MTLLIVDDQSRVVEGIMNGINWAADGFGQVYAAYNAAEARRLLAVHRVDVMLCDIEMPAENGLSLLEWMRGEGMDTKCIFLTSHISFEYVQRALRLGSVDYLVLPAPYPDIRQAVQRAVGQIETSNEIEALSRYGQMVREREDSLAESLLCSFLMTGDRAGLKGGQALGRLPPDDAVCYLAVVQVLRQEGGLERWEPRSLRYAIGNIMAEVFAGYGQACVGAEDSNGCLCYLVYSGGDAMEFDSVVRQLEYLIEVGARYLNCVLACYTDPAVRLVQAPALYKTLLARLDNNVAMRSKVFYIPDAGTAPFSGVPGRTRYSRWLQELAAGYTPAVRSEVITFLDDLAENDRLNAGTLQRFFQAMVQLIAQVMDEHGLPAHDLYNSGEASALYRDADKSLESMKRFIHFVLDKLDENGAAGMDAGFQADQAIAYIHEHLEEDIRRADLAGYFHMNPDYLARVFKKETGKTLKEFITEERVAVAQSLLRTTSLPVGIIAAKVGYSSFSHFSKVYLKATGRSPSEDRHG